MPAWETIKHKSKFWGSESFHIKSEIWWITDKTESIEKECFESQIDRK